MTKIIIDSSIILRYPKVLGLKIKDIHFIVPLSVIGEINSKAQDRGSSYDKRVDLIEKSALEGIISIINTNGPILAKYSRLLGIHRLGGTDISILALAIEEKDKGNQVKIATQDKIIEKVAREYNIGILDSRDISNLIEENESNSEVVNDIHIYIKNENRSFLNGIILGILICLIGILLYYSIGFIISKVNIWGTIIMILLVGIILFILREKQRLGYGFFEFFVGVGAIIILFIPDNFDYNKLHFTLDFNLKLLGGLYIMVRGQDNIVKAIKDTKIGLILKDKFGIGK